MTRIAAALVLAFGPCTTVPRTPPPAITQSWWAAGKVTRPGSATGLGAKSATHRPGITLRPGVASPAVHPSRSFARPPFAEETRWRSTRTDAARRPHVSVSRRFAPSTTMPAVSRSSSAVSDLQRAEALPEPWRSIVRCESLNDRSWPVTSTSTARGWFQFLRSTWRSLGLHGDPAAASFDAQYAAARRLAARDGLRAWDCARILGVA